MSRTLRFNLDRGSATDSVSDACLIATLEIVEPWQKVNSGERSISRFLHFICRRAPSCCSSMCVDNKLNPHIGGSYRQVCRDIRLFYDIVDSCYILVCTGK